MSFIRHIFIILVVSQLISGMSLAGESRYKYISATELESRLRSQQPTNIIDIQVEEEFSQQHIRGAEPTYAYPVKSEADRTKLDATIGRFKNNSDPVVIICPRGAGGAKRTYDYLLQEGIASERLLILEKGQQGWACADLTEGVKTNNK